MMPVSHNKKMHSAGRYGLEEQQTPQIPPSNVHLQSISTETGEPLTSVGLLPVKPGKRQFVTLIASSWKDGRPQKLIRKPRSAEEPDAHQGCHYTLWPRLAMCSDTPGGRQAPVSG